MVRNSLLFKMNLLRSIGAFIMTPEYGVTFASRGYFGQNKKTSMKLCDKEESWCDKEDNSYD